MFFAVVRDDELKKNVPIHQGTNTRLVENNVRYAYDSEKFRESIIEKHHDLPNQYSGVQ